jgi:hypothetical protein
MSYPHRCGSASGGPAVDTAGQHDRHGDVAALTRTAYK